MYVYDRRINNLRRLTTFPPGLHQLCYDHPLERHRSKTRMKITITRHGIFSNCPSAIIQWYFSPIEDTEYSRTTNDRVAFSIRTRPDPDSASELIADRSSRMSHCYTSLSTPSSRITYGMLPEVLGTHRRPHDIASTFAVAENFLRTNIDSIIDGDIRIRAHVR